MQSQIQPPVLLPRCKSHACRCANLAAWEAARWKAYKAARRAKLCGSKVRQSPYQLKLLWRSRNARLASNETVVGANPTRSTFFKPKPKLRNGVLLKPDEKTAQEKRIRAVALELKSLRHRINHPSSVLLKDPIQRGWVRRYILTKDAEARPDRETLAAILRDIGREVHSRHPLFLQKKRRRSRKLVEIKQPLHEILIDRWSIKHHPWPEEWKRYFHLEYKPYCGGLQWFYVFTDTHLFELKVEPHWLTHVKIIDSAAIEREAGLMAWMEKHNGYNKYCRLKGRRANWHPIQSWQFSHEREKQEKAMLRRFLITSEEADMKSSMGRFHFSFFAFPHVAQLEGGTPLRTETVRVQILPWGPFRSLSPTRRGSRLKIGLVPVRIWQGANNTAGA